VPDDRPDRQLAWRAYERPAEPRPEQSERSEQPEHDGLGTLDVPRRRFVAHWWTGLSSWEQFRVVLAVVFFSGWGVVGVLNLVTGDDDPVRVPREAVAVEADPPDALDTLDVTSLEELVPLLRQEAGTTVVTHVGVYDGAVRVQVPGAGDQLVDYLWNGGGLVETGTGPFRGVAFDLARVDLRDVVRAGRTARRDAGGGDTETWWVGVAVPDGATAPLITAQAVGDAGPVTVEIDDSGEVVRS